MAIWTPDPGRIRAYYQNGLGNMGDVADPQSAARFAMERVEVDGVEHEVEIWSLVAVRVRFVGGSGSATLTARLDHRDPGGLYDFTLANWPSAGTGGRAAIVHVPTEPADLLGVYPFFRGDELVFTWTNPDAGNMRWILEILAAWAKLAGS